MGRLIRGFDKKLRFRFIFAETKDIVEEARTVHHTSTTATAALGRLLTQALIMGAELKSPKDSITLSIRGNGPAGKLIAVADSQGHVKGYAENPQAEVVSRPDHKLDVGTYVGREGILSIVRDYGLKEPYQATSPLVSGEIAEDFAHYYAVSEQIPTVLILGVLVDTDYSVKSAGGLLVQAMPQVKDEEFVDLEEAVKNLPAFSHLLADLTMEEILERYFSKLEFEVADEQKISYACDCSEEKVTRALISIGKEDLSDLAEDEDTEVVCEFCKKKYLFSRKEIEDLIKEAEAKS